MDHGLFFTAMTFVFVVVFISSAYQIYAHLYFSDEKFISLKESVAEFIEDCNDLNDHIGELRSCYKGIESAKQYGSASIYDDSRYRMKREHWKKFVKHERIHNCSLSVCNGAKKEPFKYFCKYFQVEQNEESLSFFEGILSNFSDAETGKKLLKDKKLKLLQSIQDDVPTMIMTFSEGRLLSSLGMKEIDLFGLYFPVYRFSYVSPGGNSSVNCDIKLDINNLNEFVGYLGNLVKFRKSIAGQRALMTNSFRESIKLRDNYTCQICSISALTTESLLLEIDHIIPLSKGGATVRSNLQTLCWKCNRSKGAKIL